MVAAGAAGAALWASRGGGSARPLSQPPDGRAAWRGLVGGQRVVILAPRAIVVLRAPSVAGQLAAAGGSATGAQEIAWNEEAVRDQDALVARLRAAGIDVSPDFRFTRTLNGFSTALDPAEAARVEDDPAVAVVYPVRVAYPAADTTAIVSGAAYGAGSGHRPPRYPAGLDGAGVTIALLDTAVAARLPYLHHAVLPEIDVVGGGGDPALEPHGTEMAGLVVGAAGPAGLAGSAPDATLLPIRVAGLQPDDRGGSAVFARSDQLLAGLEHAVDPNADGDEHDAVRIALVPLAEPFAAFADGPEARAARGAAALGTLLVGAAGNDGAAAPSTGDLAAPGGAAAALTVGALDARTRLQLVQVSVHAGKTSYAGDVPVAGAVAPQRSLDLAVAARGAVAGRAALVSPGVDVTGAVRRAAADGALAVLVDGGVAPGGVALDPASAIPVLSLPPEVAAVLRGRRGARVSLEPAGSRPNPHAGHIAPFSSTAPAGGQEVLARGVAVVTAAPDGWATVSGTSAAAAVAAAAAATIAQARPGLSAAQLRRAVARRLAKPPSAPRAKQIGRASCRERV